VCKAGCKIISRVKDLTPGIFAPRAILFKLLMLVALLEVALLVSAAGELIGPRTI